MKVLLLLLLLSISFDASATAGPSVQKFQVHKGDTIYSLLQRFYFNQSQINQILQSKKSFSKQYSLFPKQIFWVTVDDKKKLTRLIFFHPKKDESLVFWRAPTDSGFTFEPLKFTIKIKTTRGFVKGSLVGSIQNKVPSLDLAYRFLDAYKLEYNLNKDILRNSPFVMTYEEKYLMGQFIKYGEVLKTGLKLKGKTDTRYFIKTPRGGSFVSVKNRPDSRPLFAPVDYLRITSDYQRRRFHPIKKRRIAHMGVDFELPRGSNIYASLAGEVLKRGKNRAAGRYVAIKHKNGLITYYNHLSKLYENITPGTQVSTGQLIGAVGCSGYCTKPHLHFAVKKQGRFVNPAKLLRAYPFNQKKQLQQEIATLKKKSSLL